MWLRGIASSVGMEQIFSTSSTAFCMMDVVTTLVLFDLTPGYFVETMSSRH